MKKKYFNKKERRRRKSNIKRKKFSKRIGGVVGVSVLVENRDVNAQNDAKKDVS